MATQVHCESYLPGYYSMRDLNLDCSSSNWPLFYGDKTMANGQYYNSFLPGTATNAYPGHDKDVLKKTMLRHEAIFKQQVFELHRLYKIQKDMMDDIKRKELHKHLVPMETSSSSNLLVSQMPSEEAWKWLHKPSFPLVNSVSARPSVSGTEIVSSPLSCTKGNNTQAGRFPSQNGCSSKDYVILESRPSKVRKRLFDLQLPADEYIDTEDEEQSPNNKISDTSSYPSSIINHKLASESSVKLNIGGGAKIDCNGNASRSASCLRNSVGLADLNEPIQVEEAEIKDLDLAAKPKSQFLLGLPKENFQNSQHGSNNGTSTNLQVESKGIGREWLSHMNETGHSKIHFQPFPQGLQPDKSHMSSQRTHTTPDKVHHPSEILTSDHSREDLWRDRTVHGLEFSERSRDLSSFNHLERVVPSHVPIPYPLVHASDLDNTWSHSVSSWGKPSSSLTQKLISIQTHLPLNSSVTLSSISQSSAHSHDIDKWHLNSGSGSKPGLASGLPNRNGFYHGSSSGSKDVPTRFPSAGFDYLNCNKDDKVASERSINFGPGSYLKGSNVIDMKLVKDFNLNAILSKSSSNEVIPQQVLEIIDEERKCEDHLEVLPWLKGKPASKNEGISTRRDSNSSQMSFLHAASNQLSNKSDIVKGPNQLFTQKITLASCDHEIGAKRNKVGDCQVTRKILGFPIFGNACTPKKESSSLVSTSASLRCPPQGEDISNAGKHRVIDINLACDPESGAQIAAEVLIVEKRRDNEVANFRNFDLNSCVSEDEVTLAPSVASTSVNVKIAVEIDLEVPAVPETEEDILPVEDQKKPEMSVTSPQHKAEQPQDEEAFRIAAEAIVAISTSGHLNHVEGTACNPLEAPSADSLMWFVEVVSSYVVGDCKSRGQNGGDNEVSSSEEIDYFEAMTLMLREITEEEYMPKPLVPENQKVEETGTVQLPNQPRRGQARRGRQRRDFQRDILPGLASLSRHEVIEDLQTFGGLMRATGHPWQSGLTRRNGTRTGGARGRRRSVVLPAPAETASTICMPLMEQLNNIVGLEDKALTGWGKTPRRPRRQRCHAGNPTLITLT